MMTLTKTIKYALFITFFAVLWSTVFEIVSHRPLVGVVVYWSVSAWGFFIFLMSELENKGKKGKS